MIWILTPATSNPVGLILVGVILVLAWVLSNKIFDWICKAFSCNERFPLAGLLLTIALYILVIVFGDLWLGLFLMAPIAWFLLCEAFKLIGKIHSWICELIDDAWTFLTDRYPIVGILIIIFLIILIIGSCGA